MHKYNLLITCEHATNHIPKDFELEFSEYGDLLNSHRGIDFGAHGIANRIVEHLKVPFFQAKVSRLLIDNNRSLLHPNCFSEVSRHLSDQAKKTVIQEYYNTYRTPVINYISTKIALKQPVLHLSIHSFTPVMNGINRKADIGLLYDARRSRELELAHQWQRWLQQHAPDLKIRRNYPYMGKTDGLVSHLRTIFPEKLYVGFEIESNQAKVSEVANQQRFGDLIANMLSTY